MMTSDLPRMWAVPWVRHLVLSNPAILLVIGLVCLIPLVVTPSVRTSIRPGDVRHEIGRAYLTPMTMGVHRPFTVDSDAPGATQRSTLVVFEDGRPLGPPHTAHAVVRESGNGAYSHWSDALYFSASDSSDPRTNGRSYVAVAKTRLPVSLAAILILISLSCFWVVRQSLKRRFDALPDSDSVPTDVTVAGMPRTLPLAIVVTGISFGVAMVAVPEYRTNDDVDMRFIAEGLIGDGSQTQFLMYQNVLIGIVLRALYQVLPGFPWYDIALAGGAILGAILCQFAVYRLCRRRRELAFCVLLSFFFFGPIFRQFQFTASATLLAGGALLMFMSIWERTPARRAALWTASAAIASAFVLASLVRFHAAFLAALAILPVVGVINLRWPQRSMLLPIAALACGAALAPLTDAYNKRYYASSSGWETFWIEKPPRAAATQFSFLDRSRPEAVQAALSTAGWTENDYRMLSGWMFMNRSLFSIERMQRFADLAPRESWAARVTNAYDWLVRPQSLVWLLAALCLAPVLLRRSVGGLAIAALSIAWTVIVLFIVGTVFRANHFHVLWPLYGICALANAGLIFSRAPREVSRGRFRRMEDRVLAAAVLVAVVLAAGWQAERMVSQGADSENLRHKVNRDLAAWPVQKGDTVVVWDHNFPYEVWARPFRAVQAVPFEFLHTGDPTVTPLLEPIYAKWRTSNVPWAICNIPGIHLVDSRLGYARPHADTLTTYMREHHGQVVEVTASFEGNALTLYVCRKRAG